MLQWKQRLYAFLLRRVLGPLLDAESLTKLYQTIDISLHEGRFALNDVALNTDYFANLLKDKLPNFRIRKARIRRLEIHLTLQDHSLDEGEELSSLAWRAIKLGSIAATEGGSPAVSLLALVEIDGLVIEIEPHPFATEPSEDGDPASLPTPTADTESSKSILSSYVDAALSSLRLTMKMSNLQVRICSGRSEHEPETWLEFKLKSVSYHDVDVTSSGEEDSEYETVMQKAVDINRVTILVGETATALLDDDQEVPEKATASTSTIALLEGSSRVCLRAIEYKTSTSSTTRWEPSTSDCRRLQHDVEMNLDQRLNLSVDESSLLQIQTIVQSFRDVSRTRSSSDSGEHRSSAAAEVVHQDSSIDQADLSAIDGIMKQYQEARLYAERNEIRGGILIPSTAEEDGRSGDEVTFDAFFDANEKSFYRYSNVLRESVLLQVDTEKADHDFVHTKIRFHLKGGGVKVSFRAASDSSAASTIEAAPSRRPDDYMLLTFTDLNLSSSLSLRESDFELSVANLDLEDSQIDKSYGQGSMGSAGRRAEICSVLQFSQSRGGGGNASLDDSDILLEAPCLSVRAKVEKEGECRTSDVELTLEALEFTYRQAAMSNLSQLLNTMKASGELHPKQAESVGKSESSSGNNVKFLAFCDSISVNIPLPREKDWGSLYNRCGYDAAGSMTTRSSLGIFFDQVTLELKGEDSVEESASLSCHHALVFASSPCGKHNLDRKLLHFDIIAMSGLTDVHPVIPVSVKLYRNNKDGGDGVNFPIVPTISSFKARQEDEDEDNRIDRVLSSKLNDDLPMGVRKGLRADDPQSAMILEASESEIDLVIRIPEIIGDLSSNELVALSEMLESLRENLVPASNTSRSSTEPPASTQRVGVSLNCDYLSLAVHGSLPEPTTDLDGCNSLSFSYMIKLDRLKTHVLLENTGLRHVRVLAHELDFFESKCSYWSTQSTCAVCVV
jgi:hypothetical protein